MICPKCGKRYKNHDPQPRVIQCCGESLTLEPGQPNFQPCVHRGRKAGRLSCGCGIAYHCNKLGIVCSDRRPKEELYTITLNMPLGSMQLDESTYQGCDRCAKFQVSEQASEKAPSPG